jgi:hypothetical protein
VEAGAKTGAHEGIRMKGRQGKFGMLGVERGKGVIMQTTGARHIIYGGLVWKGARQMSEDEEGLKETGHATRLSGEQMAGEKKV